jgi:hypothetical protein
MADKAPVASLSFASAGRGRNRRPDPSPAAGQGFATGPEQRGGERRRSSRKRKPAARLSSADWGPLGKHPDLEAIVARQRLGLPLSGRLAVATVNQAWKRAAGEHHPDRGGAHDTMQAINGARDLLLGRQED